MAAMTYRCPVGPDCPDRTEPGYCQEHPSDMLERVRARPAARAERDAASDRTGADEPLRRGPVSVRFRGRSFPVPDDGLVLGRLDGPLADVPGMADLTQVSRYHARLYWLGDILYVRDGSPTRPSENGTYVDGVRICDPRRIGPGQQLRLGLDVPVELVFEELDEFGLPR